MAVSAKVGTFNSATATGNQAVTGVGFQPKLIIFFYTFATATGAQVHAVWAMGAAASSSLRHSASAWSQDAVNPTDCQATTSDVRCIRVQDAAGVTRHNADFVSFDGDGFTINWTTADGAARVINYIALGGDITAWVGQINSKTTPGTQAYTGVGFLPTALLLLKPHGTGSTGTAGGGVSIAPSVGFISGPNNRGYLAAVEGHGISPSDSRRLARTGAAYGVINPTTPTSLLIEADFVSFDSDGFTLDWLTASVTARTIIAIAINGVSAKVDSFDQRDGSGSQEITGLGFVPRVVLFAGTNAPASESGSTDDLDMYFGAASGASAEGCIWAGSDDNVATSAADSAISTNSCIQDRDVGTGALDIEADLTSLDANGFTLNYGTGDSVLRQNLFLALGDPLVAVSAPKDGCHEARAALAPLFDGPHESLFGFLSPALGLQEARASVSADKLGLHEALTRDGLEAINRIGLHEGTLGLSDPETGVHECTGNPGFFSVSEPGVHESLVRVSAPDSGAHEGLVSVSTSLSGLHEARKADFIAWKQPRRHSKWRPPQQLPGVADGG